MEGNSFILSLSENKENIILEDTKKYKRCDIPIKTAYSDMTIFQHEMTFPTFEKIIISAITKSSIDVMYIITEDNNIIIDFIWKSFISGECCVVIPKENFTWNKSRVYMEISKDDRLRPVLDYIDECFEEFSKKNKEEGKTVNINNKLIDFGTIIKDKMIINAVKYEFAPIATKFNTGDIDRLKYVIFCSTLFNKLKSKGLCYLFTNYCSNEKIPFSDMNIYKTKNSKNMVKIEELPFKPDVNITIKEDTISIDGCIFLNVDHYRLEIFKDTPRLEIENLFADHKICKLDVNKKMKSKNQFITFAYGVEFGIHYKGVVRYKQFKNTTLQYILYTLNNYMYLRVVGAIIFKMIASPNSIYQDIPKEIIMTTDLKDLNKNYIHNSPICGAAKKIQLDNSLVYFDLDNVELNIDE